MGRLLRDAGYHPRLTGRSSFAGEFRLELPGLQLQDHECPQPQVVEKEVEAAVFVAGFEVMLGPHECEAFSWIQDKSA